MELDPSVAAPARRRSSGSSLSATERLRGLLRLLPLVALPLVAGCGDAPYRNSDGRPLSIRASHLLVTVGDVDATTARLWAWAPTSAKLRLTLEPPAAPGDAPETLVPDDDGRAVIVLPGLTPARRYRYRLEAAHEAVHGEFVTAPAAEDAAPVTIAWSGDLGARGHCRSPDGWPVFHAIADRRPDLFLFVGDTIYADHRCGASSLRGADFKAQTLEQFRAKHLYNRGDPAVQRLFRRTSVSAIWDDHDVRSNFAGPVEALAPLGLRAFLEFWPIVTSPEDPSRLYRRLRWGRLLEIFVLDTRRYRSENWRVDGPRKTMLGRAQRRWLVEAVAASTARWKVVVSSVPLAIAKGWPFGDSWARQSVLGYRSGFATERDAIFQELRRHGVRELVVLGADVHFGALMTHRPLEGLLVHELLAGPLAAKVKAPQKPTDELNTTIHGHHGGAPTFGELQATVDGLTARLFDVRGQLLSEVRLALPP